MKPSFYLLLIALAHFFCVSTNVSGQSIITPDNPLYDKLKAEGKLPDKKGRFLKPSFFSETNNPPVSAQVNPPFFKACKELIPIDSTFSVVPFLAGTLGPPPFYRNDDASTQKITIPFNFCFYGNSFNQLYINNNGNISFDGPQVTYRPDSFPTVDFMAVSAFWADVDTRNFNSGVVYYKIEPSYMIVTWDHVGYYNSHADKRNTFQLIITDGIDTSLLSPGKNVGFRYDQMEWTTGDIGGLNGFSLITNHATVGANKSDSVHFVQFGRFGIPGDAYDGPYAGTDGVSWLNGRVFEFNACSGTNIEPIVNNFNYCDTIYSCVGDTNLFDLSFLSPERNQITSTVITTTASSGLTVLQNTPGDVNTIKARFIGEFANVGYQHISFFATDNGLIPASSALDIVVKVEQLNTPLSIAGGGINICPGTTTPLTATTGFEKYYWSNNSNVNPANVQAGTYYVTGKMGKCYLRSDTVQVGNIPVTIPVIQGNNTTQLCLEDSALLTVTTSFPQYIWSNGDTTQSAYLHPGFPFVTVIDTNGCAVKSATFHLPQFQMQPLLVLGAKSICPGDSLTLSASPGFFNYQWSTGDSSTSITVPSGIYSIKAIDTNNCINNSLQYSISNFTVVKPVISGKTDYCFGDSAKLSVAPNYLNYSWNNGDTTYAVSASQGSYFLSVVDQNNCESNSDTVIVSQFPQIPLSILGDLDYCPGDSALLFTSNIFSNPNWSNGSRADSIYVFSGSYALVAKDTNGCFSNAPSVQVQENITTIPVISGSLFACPDDSTLLSVNPSFSSYLWSSGATTNPAELPAGNYFVSTIDSNACKTQSATITIQNHPVSIPSISGDTICCSNDSIVLTATAGFAAYSWSNGSNFSSATLPPGNYVVSVWDANNCLTKSAAFTVGAYPYTLPTTTGTNNFCFGDSVLWTVNPAFPHYLWSSGDTTQNTFLQSGTHTVTVKDAYNCTFKSNNFTLQNYPVESPIILGKNYLCANDSLLLLAPSGFSQIQWNTGATSNSIYAQNGNYTLTARDSNNCLSYSLPHSVAISEPFVNIIGAQTICDQDSTSLSLSLAFADYNWSNGSQNASVWVQTGNYSVEIHDSIGCKGSANIVVSSYVLPTAFFIHEAPVAEINEPIQFFDASQGNGDTLISYTWTLSNTVPLSNLPNPILVFEEEGNMTITLTVTTNNGCSDSYSETIQVLKSIKIPNIITPNGDGLNDLFEIVNLDLSKSSRLVVFDRWGKLVYNSNNYQNDWNAEKIEDGVYYFTLQLEGDKEFKGSLSILH